MRFPSFDEWLSNLDHEEQEFYIKEYGNLEEAYECELSTYECDKYHEWKDDQLFKDEE